MSPTYFYGVRTRQGRAVTSSGVREGISAATRFSKLTPELLAQIPALAMAADVRDRLEILPMHPIHEKDRQVPIECLTEALQIIQPDTRGMAFVSEEFVRETGTRLRTLAELLPYLRESISTFGETPVRDPFRFPSMGTKSVRIYLEILFHYGGAKPLSLIFDCFIKRHKEIDKIRLSFILGDVIDESFGERFEKYGE
ncbi:MAG: hypothetical protein WC901_00705 [Candidatus Margulisiibacteriota bacterium]